MNKNHLLFAVFFSLMVFVEAVSAVGKQRITSTADNQSSASKPEPTATISVDATRGKKISDHLFGIFFEDLNYAADGGLYAELIQNRSFEYSPADRKGWNPLTAWEYTTDGFGYGTISIETTTPLNGNNPHYVVLNVEDEGQQGVGLTNSGFDGIVIRSGEKYDFSAFIRPLCGQSMPFEIKLQNSKGDICGKAIFATDSNEWKKYTATISATQSNDSCHFVILAKGKGKFAMDEVSLFPQNTFKSRTNGLRADLAQTIADLKPKFMRFPGGCLVHGDGLGNMYRWKNTIGPIEQRVEQRDIWNYHQSVGLGYFEYFQFCEDIGAKPLPVVPAAVSCQNSGGTWRIGGTGQRGLPPGEMQSYIQEILDLIEYANGSASTTWGAKRAKAGHPQSFNLEYIGIGNEDKQTPEFRERFKMIYDAVRAIHPEITIVGTVGPAPDGEDFDLGWKFAGENKVSMVDEHYYKEPSWFLKNLHRYDTYNRKASHIYVGEYAAHDIDRKNTLRSALAEAAYMTSLERNGDVVGMASYAPLLAKSGNTQWIPDMINFNNTGVMPSVNYYVQQLFGQNSGDQYLASDVSLSEVPGNGTDLLPISVTIDSRSGDLIIKAVNNLNIPLKSGFKIKGIKSVNTNGTKTILSGLLVDLNAVPQISEIKVGQEFGCELPPNSLTIIRIRK